MPAQAKPTARRRTSVDTFVGAKVRARRMQLSLSQTDLANALGITFQQVQKYEKGTNRVSASKMWEISKCLKVQPSFFFDGLDGAPNAKAAQTEMPMRDAVAFLGAHDGAKFIPAMMSMPRPIAAALVKLAQLIAKG